MNLKKYILVTAIALILSSFAYALPPTEPTALGPANATSLSYIPEFLWVNSSDPDGDPVTYILEFANDSNFMTTVNTANFTTASNSTTPVLPSEGIFYWHVIATDGPSNSSGSDVMQFIYDFTMPNITNETDTPNPAFNETDVTLTAIISDNLDENITISSVWVETNYTGILLNYTARKELDGIYSHLIDNGNLTTNQSISYTFYANDTAGNEAKGAQKYFAVNGTLLFINPSLPDGLNEWYVINPSIELKTNLDSGYILYKWDELTPLVYTGAFNATQILPVGGKQILKYWSSSLDNTTTEPQKNLTIKVDVTDPRVISTYPGNNSVISNTNPLISAVMDDTYFDNSMINTSTIAFVFDDVLVESNVSGASTINATYLASSLANGLHNASISAYDFAGNFKSYNWSFTIDIIPIGLVILNPENASYNVGNIEVNMTVNKTVDFYKSLDGSSYTKVCSSCQDYKKIFSFSEGSHLLSIKAVNGAAKTEVENVSFFIDTVKPVIQSTKPENNDFVSSGNFSIIYKETNLKSANLYYKQNFSGTYNNVSLPCNSSISQTENADCSIAIDLSSFDGDTLNYYFEISDGLFVESSSIKDFTVDTSPPAIILASPMSTNYSTKNLLLDIMADETTTISYIDNFTERTLCRSCTEYNKTKSFKEGIHNITFVVVDRANNQNNVSLNLLIDSKKPVIKKITPLDKKPSNGNFTVQYTEKNISKVRLFYKNETSAMNEVILPSCLSGTNQDCSIAIDMSSYENQTISFMFNISDSLSETASRINNVTIDSSDPVLSVYSPMNTTYASSSILFNLTSTETSYISYSDNGGAEKTLCSSCTSISVNKIFASGSHNVAITALDKAGNIATGIVSFTSQ